MDTVRLAYRDNDRTPFIYCVKEMAARYYDINIEIQQIKGDAEYEACIFDGTADVIPEHLEYLFDEVARNGRKAMMFLCPSAHAEGELVIAPGIESVNDLRGKKIAVRTHGRPFATHVRIRALGIGDDVEFVPVEDSDVGRWRQWTTLLNGECAATYVTCLYLPPALAAGLKILPVPPYEIVGLFGHGCATEFALANEDVMLRYVKAASHAMLLMKLRREEALTIAEGEPARLMKLTGNRAEIERQFDCIAGALQLKAYPTTAAIANSYEIGCNEWPGGAGINPMSLWDLHWLKKIDDEGFIDDLIARLS